MVSCTQSQEVSFFFQNQWLQIDGDNSRTNMFCTFCGCHYRLCIAAAKDILNCIFYNIEGV